jgi:hypothetical protein
MLVLRKDLVEQLRSMAREGAHPSEMLRKTLGQLDPEEINPRAILYFYFTTAFQLSDGGEGKIFGWFPDGSGTLKDADIDRFLTPTIQAMREKWDRPVIDDELDFSPRPVS